MVGINFSPKQTRLTPGLEKKLPKVETPHLHVFSPLSLRGSPRLVRCLLQYRKIGEVECQDIVPTKCWV